MEETVLGKGSFGEVVCGHDRKSGTTYAIKCLSKIRFPSDEEKEAAHLEAKIMTKVAGHPHVVGMDAYLEDKANVYFVLEWCRGGDLMKYVYKCKHFSEKVASCLFQQMLLGVKHCHEKGVVHRDLKPDNFLFASTEGRTHLKLADFGLSTIIDEPDQIITDPVGSAFFIAPEVFTKRYTKSCDIWSLGVILYLMLGGTVPFGAKATKATEVYRAIQRDTLTFKTKHWQSISAPARELITGLLEKDAAKRYTVEQALSHAWVNGDVAPDDPIDRQVVLAMYNFNANNKLRKAALRMVASTLSASDVQKLRMEFHKIDTDTSQSISVSELAAALHHLGLPAGAGVQKLMANMDFDEDGTINLEEFLVATSEMQMIYHQNNIWWAFCEYDRNKDGHITLEELKKVLKDEPDEEVRKHIDEYDTDGDGRINYEEFIRMLVPQDIEFQKITMT
uniref:Calmodulin n=1 Tax=Bicosoecida sp. CB-2014 TaxID=1486930 RepID=A0A7S1C984_9STRA